MTRNDPTHSAQTRRDFMHHAASAAGAAALATIASPPPVHAAGSDVIRIGLIGCGGRGSGAAVNAMNAGADVHLVAMAELFEDRLKAARKNIGIRKPDQTVVDDDHCFVGFDAYKKVIECADVVLIAATSHFHPRMIKAAIDAGKHVFCEKPHGLDAPGVKMSMAACEAAKEKQLCVVSGLCWRYDTAVRETMKRVQDGAIGDIVAIQENYLTVPYSLRPRRAEWSELEYQFRNWYHFNWLSGDQTAQQLIHSLDKASWALGDVPPVKAFGVGGRQVCVESQFGDQFDHHAVVFEYASGQRVFGFTRDIPGCMNTTTDIILGTKGQAYLPVRCRIEGENAWKWDGDKPSMYDAEHAELFAAIRAGEVINSGSYMHTTSMLAVLAQMVCYTGKEVTWEQAMASEQDFTLPEYNWDAEPRVKPNEDGTYPSPLPGITPFV